MYCLFPCLSISAYFLFGLSEKMLFTYGKKPTVFKDYQKKKIRDSQHRFYFVKILQKLIIDRL